VALILEKIWGPRHHSLQALTSVTARRLVVNVHEDQPIGIGMRKNGCDLPDNQLVLFPPVAGVGCARLLQSG